MYEIIKNIIENGAFRVSDLTNKIDTLWAESKLSDDDRLPESSFRSPGAERNV